MFTTAHRWGALVLSAALTTFVINSAHAQHEEHGHPTSPPAALEISGTVLCSDGPALPGAVLQVFKGNSALPLASALSDQSGRFRMRVPAGSYTLRVTYLGHAGAAQSVVVEPASPLQLGAIRLQVSAVEIDALVATAEKDHVQLRNGTTVFDAQRAGVSAGASIADLLRQVPQLEIDAAGRIAMRGSTSVLVLVNGRRTALKGEALIAFLRQMPATALEKIEVSTTSAVSQEADALAGVVDLQFRTSPEDEAAGGYSFAASAASSRQYMGSAAANGRAGALRWDALYSFSGLQPQTYTHTMRDNFFAAPEQRTSHQASNADARHLLHSLLANAAVRVNDAHSLNTRLGFSWMRGAFDNLTEFADISASGIRSSGTLTTSNLDHTIPAADAAVGWDYRSDDGRRIRMSSEMRGATTSEQFEGSYDDASAVRFLSTSMEYGQRELNWQNDGSLDVRGARVEFGHLSQWRRLAADYTTRRNVDQFDTFGHAQQINALYAAASAPLGSTFLQLGLRAEHARTRITLNGEADTRGTFTWFPSLKLHWPHEGGDAVQYQLSYARRIHRPEAATLNPYSMGEDDMNSFIGNPALRPEIADQLEFSVVRHGARTTLQATPFVRIVHDPIRPLKAISPSGHATTSWQNLSNDRSAGTDLSINTRWSPALRTTFAATLFHTRTRGAGVGSSGIFANLRGSMDVRLATHTSAQLYVFRRSAQPIEQGQMHAALNSDVALVQRFGEAQRGSLTLRLSDPFNTHKTAFHVGDETFVQHSERKVTSRMLALSLSWSLQGMQPEMENMKPEQAPRIF